jgi:hypothetical protein
MTRTILPFLLSLLSSFSPAAAQRGPSAAIEYANGRWWNGDAFVRGDRFVKGGVFVSSHAGRPAKIEDLHGAYVVPPYADAHNHMPGTAMDVSNRAMAAGIFYLMNPNNLASEAPAVREGLKGPGKVDAVFAMGAVTAPGGHPERIWQDFIGPRVFPNIKPADFLGDAYHYVTGPAEIGPVLDRLQAQGAEFVKIMVLYSEEFARRRDDPAYRGLKGLDPSLVPALVQAAHRRGLRVAAHIETAQDFRVIVAAGVDESAHMPGYAADPDKLAPFTITEADARAAARARIVLVATASLAKGYNQDSAKLARVQAMQRANLSKLKRAGVPLLIGTDENPDDAPREAAYLVDLGIFTRAEALDALTRTTPQWIFPGRRIGRLKSGYEASFLVLGGDPTADFREITDIRRRIKQGADVVLPATGSSPPGS